MVIFCAMLKLLDDIHYMITAKVVILLQIQPIILFHTKKYYQKNYDR